MIRIQNRFILEVRTTFQTLVLMFVPHSIQAMIRIALWSSVNAKMLLQLLQP